MDARSLARRYLPARLRLAVVLARRRYRDRRDAVVFARERGDLASFPNLWGRYERPILDYPGQEQFALAKRRNQAILARQLDGVVLRPGEVFSVWALARRPTAAEGYLPAAALKDRRLTAETGGAICLLSTVLYNAALLAGLEIVERHCHSVDSYGERRYFELARDAAIEYGYLDLRFRNNRGTALMLSIEVGEEFLSVSLHGSEAATFRVELRVDPPTRFRPEEIVRRNPALAVGEERVLDPGLPGLVVGGERIVCHSDGRTEREPLRESVHHAVPRVIMRG